MNEPFRGPFLQRQTEQKPAALSGGGASQGGKVLRPGMSFPLRSTDFRQRLGVDATAVQGEIRYLPARSSTASDLAN
jgi:hypothetical protein